MHNRSKRSERERTLTLLPFLMPKPKKPPDPSPLHLLCSSLPLLPSFSIDLPPLRLITASFFVLTWSLDCSSHAPSSSAVKRLLIDPLSAIFATQSSLSKVLDVTIGPFIPARRHWTPACLLIRIRSRLVCFLCVSKSSSVSDLYIPLQGSPYEAVDASLTRFETSFTLCFFQVSLSPQSSIQMQSLNCSSPLCLDQHVHVLRLHPWMLGQTLIGAWIILWMMLLLYSNSEVSLSQHSSIQMHSLNYSSPLCLDQHVHMLRLHPWMLGQTLIGEWIKLWMMMLLYSNSEVGSESYLLWNFLSFLLSLLLAIKFAHTLVVLHTCVCWHLDCVQTVRDEVWGKSPFVYEEDCPETKVFFLSSKLWLEFFLSWCPNPELKLRHCLSKLKLELKLAVCLHASGLQNSQSEQNTLLLHYVSDVWNPTTTVFTDVYYGAINCIIDLHTILNVFWKFYFSGRAGTGFPRDIEFQ